MVSDSHCGHDTQGNCGNDVAATIGSKAIVIKTTAMIVFTVLQFIWRGSRAENCAQVALRMMVVRARLVLEYSKMSSVRKAQSMEYLKQYGVGAWQP